MNQNLRTAVPNRARPIRFLWADTDVFHCRYPMLIPIFLYYSGSIYFASSG